MGNVDTIGRDSRVALGAVVMVIGLVLVVAGLFIGCTQGYRVMGVDRPAVDPWQPRPRLGTICVVRPQTFGALATALHFDNRRLVGATQGANVYFCYRVHPGWHRLVARTDNDARLDVFVPRGGRRFVQVVLRIGPDALRPVTELRARTLLPRLTYVVSEPTRPNLVAPYRAPVPAWRGPPRS